jgi:hypothetical protein
MFTGIAKLSMHVDTFPARRSNFYFEDFLALLLLFARAWWKLRFVKTPVL